MECGLAAACALATLDPPLTFPEVTAAD